MRMAMDDGAGGVTTADAPTAGPLAGPLVRLLLELDGVLASLTPAQYTSRCGEAFSNGTVGGHIRHCLDHIRALVDGRETGTVDYDHRARGTCIERDPDSGRVEIEHLARALDEMSRADPAERLPVTVMPTRDGRSVTVESTLGRELSFVLSHTVHHNAMVRGMALSLGVGVPVTFGYAPSTLAHLDAGACAR
jgi:hypothetical protein